jgi:hypothetical protein
MLSISRLMLSITIGWLVTSMSPMSVQAHPSSSLVRDTVRDIVYYSDLQRVWQIDREGRRTVAVPDVHAHYLRLDADGNLYGDDRKLFGEDGWTHRVWRLTPEGRFEEVIPWKNGPWVDDYGFVADPSGALYWASCRPRDDGPCVVKRRRGDTVDVAAGGAEFDRPLEYLAEDRRGGVLVADGPDIKRITPTGSLELFAAGVTDSSSRFSLMGMYAAADGSLYVAAYDDQTILRLTEDGRKTVVARSAALWHPSAVLLSPEGLWVLEFAGDRARVRVMLSDGRERVWGPAS